MTTSNAKKRSTSDFAYQKLSDLVIAGQLAPGDRLSMRELARRFEFSPMPVREAVNRLVADEALTVLPQSAVVVPIMTRERFVELRTMRVALEGVATAVAAVNRTPAELKRILAVHDRLVRLANSTRPDGPAVVRCNQQLHFAIYAAAHMPSLLKVITGFWLRVGPVLNLDLRTSPERLRNLAAHSHHRRLVEAIGQANAEAARSALVDDIEAAAEYILSLDILPSSKARNK